MNHCIERLKVGGIDIQLISHYKITLHGCIMIRHRYPTGKGSCSSHSHSKKHGQSHEIVSGWILPQPKCFESKYSASAKDESCGGIGTSLTQSQEHVRGWIRPQPKCFGSKYSASAKDENWGGIGTSLADWTSVFLLLLHPSPRAVVVRSSLNLTTRSFSILQHEMKYLNVILAKFPLYIRRRSGGSSRNMRGGGGTIVLYLSVSFFYFCKI